MLDRLRCVLFGLAMALGAGNGFAAEQAVPPNLTLLLADDMGWADVSYHNKRAETPNIDRLIAAGMELDRFYVAPMCSPTRAGLMTGRYPIRFGLARAVIPPQRNFGLRTDETTLPEALTDLGYKNRGVFGKWHLGHRQAQWHPLRQGFTHFYGHYNGAIDYFQLTRENERDWHSNWTPSPEQGYATELIGEAVCQWIETVAQQESPYLCYVPFNAPHSPFQAMEEDLQRYASIGERGAEKRQTIAAMIWRMDLVIGQILDAVEKTGEAENTLICFFSDNGGVRTFPNNNKPLRGNKLTVFEGGVRVPAGIRWPARVTAGQTSQQVCGYIDVLPTLLTAAGEDLTHWTGKPLDGVNLLPMLTEQKLLPERPWFSYHGQSGEQDEHLAMTEKGWKLMVRGPNLQSSVLTPQHNVSLFHLDEDPYETTNLAMEEPDRVMKMLPQLVEYRQLQPLHSVPPYKVKTPGFVPPANWELKPE